MRIALIAPPWLPVPPPAYGGTEGVIDRLARGFQAAGHEVLLFTTGDSTCPVPRASALEHSVPEQVGQSHVELHHLICAYRRVRGFDIIHDHTIIGPVFADRVEGLPVVTTSHGPFTPELAEIFRVAAARTAIVAISQHQAASAPQVPVARVIHHGLDPDEFAPGLGDGGYLLFLGRFSPDKGAREAALVARETGMPLVIAAKMREAAEIQYFEEEVKPLLGAGIDYVGEVGLARKTELLQHALALVNPIQWAEPFGLVMIEAFACGTPVLAFGQGSAPEIVTDGRTGYVCDSVEEMAARVVDVKSLDRAECRAELETRFSSGRMVTEYLDLYEELRRLYR